MWKNVKELRISWSAGFKPAQFVVTIYIYYEGYFTSRENDIWLNKVLVILVGLDEQSEEYLFWSNLYMLLISSKKISYIVVTSWY